jgi:glucose/mannose transport system permease protein
MTTFQVQRILWRTTVYILLFLMAMIFLLPLYVVVVTALKEPIEIRVERAWDFPTHLYWQSFTDAWRELRPQFQNSLVLTINATALSAVIGSLNGYVLAKWRIPGEKILFPLMLFGMFIPYQAILIPLFAFLRDIGLSGGLPGLILVHVVYGLPITTLIFRNFYVQIPDEILEASAIDGAGFFNIYGRVVFPLSLPAFVVVVIWQFTQIWNEFLFAVMLTSNDTAPITVPLAELAGGEAVQWNFPMAGAIIAALPTMLVYIIMGRYFIRGLLAGSVKG